MRTTFFTFLLIGFAFFIEYDLQIINESVFFYSLINMVIKENNLHIHNHFTSTGEGNT